MAVTWDTSSAARLGPASRAYEVALARWHDVDPIAVTATTLMEVEYGLAKLARTKSAAARRSAWLSDVIDAGVVVVLEFDDRAASMTGALRAASPLPPAGKPRTRSRSKADSRVAWICDLQTASTAFAHGYSLASADAHHHVIADLLARLAPGAPPLEVIPPPRLD